MANTLYPKFKQALVEGLADADLDGSGTTGVYIALIDTGVYTYDSTHEYYSSLSGSVVAEQELLSKTTVNGLFDSADPVLYNVSGNSVEALVLYRKNAGANTTWRLIAYIDTGITGLPTTPAGGHIFLYWNASGIFSL